MKLKYIAIFALAFAVCAGWNLLFDAPKTAKPAVETAATKLWTTRSRKSPST